MATSLTILGSGSSGNCALLESEDTRLLIDAGFSVRQIRKRLAAIGRVPENLNGVLITHEHSDHIAGLAGLADKLAIPLYCNRPTKEAIEFLTGAKFEFRLFGTGSSFEVGDVSVDTFTVPHDAQEPVGFLIHTPAGRIAFVTDLGHVTKLVIERVRPANVLVLETNYDVKMLQDCPHRPWSLKQRIFGRHGHLSNEDAANALADLMTAELRHLYLGHLSRQCNLPALAQTAVNTRLDAIGARHCRVELTSQNDPCPTLTL